MRRFLVAHDDAAGAIGLPHRFALHQHGDAGGQPVDLPRLTGDHIIQLIGQAFQMRQTLFDFRAHLAPFLLPG